MFRNVNGCDLPGRFGAVIRFSRDFEQQKNEVTKEGRAVIPASAHGILRRVRTP